MKRHVSLQLINPMSKTFLALMLVFLSGVCSAADEPGVLRDPTDPSGNGGAMHSGSGKGLVAGTEILPSLGAIIVRDEVAIAVINGKRTRVADHIDGYVVKQISRKEVVLSRAGRQFYLQLPGHGNHGSPLQ